jgi:exodeoxyribonuclease VII large subunit
MREQMMGLQQRIHQAWSVRVENWKRDQSHYQSQLEMLNPQRTLERGYSVILSKDEDQLRAVRSPKELTIHKPFQIQMAEGNAEVSLAEIKINPD